MSGGSPEFYGFTTIIIIGGASICTGVIWLSGKNQPNPSPRGFEVIQPAQRVEER